MPKARWKAVRAVAVGGVCAAVGITTVLGQATQQQPVFRAGVDLVRVEVVVVDGTGQPVHGLTQESFRVFDRRKPQTVSVFEEVTRDRAAIAAAPIAAAPADVADNQAAAAQRMVVLVIDDVHLDHAREDRAKDLAKQVIQTIGSGASMAVLFTSGSHSTEVTDDHAALLAAVNTLKAGQAVRRPQPAPETPGTRNVNGQAFFQAIEEFKTIDDAARMLASDDVRRKTFVMISEGINKNLTGMFDNAFTPCEAHGPVPTQPGQPSVIPCGSSVAMHAMMEDLRRANVTMYILDPRGAVSEQDLAVEDFPQPGGMRGRPDPITRWGNPVRLAQDGVNIMAEASGGFAVTNSDEFGAGIQMIADDLNHYYLLGFYPTDPGGEGYRRLDVSIAGHPDWVLRFRRGYLPAGSSKPPAGTDPLISAVTPKTDLPLRLVALPLPTVPGSPNTRVSVVLEVSGPPATLVDSSGELHDDVTFQVAAIQLKKKELTARIGNHAKLTLKPIGASASSVGYTIPASLTLPPGSYQLRASATSDQTKKSGSVYLLVDVPDFTATPIAVSGVALGYANGSHVAVASADPAQTDLGLPFVPTLDRTFARSDSLRAYAEIPHRDPNQPVEATATLADAGGKTVVATTQRFASKEHAQLDATLSLAALSPGPYTLSVSATDGKHTAVREIPITVK